MAVTTSSDIQSYRVFLCYKENTAAIANMFRQTMEADPKYEYGKIWYSDLEGYGNFIKDIPRLIEQAEWILFFIGEAFTSKFLDGDKETNINNVAAMEMVAIEKERQTREKDGKTLNMLSINIDGASFDETCAKDLRHLFRNAGILQEESVDTYRGLNHIPFQSRNDWYLPFIQSHIAPYCAVGQAKKPSDYLSNIYEILSKLQEYIYQANEQCGIVEGYVEMVSHSEKQVYETYYLDLCKHVEDIRSTINTINSIILSTRQGLDNPASPGGGKRLLFSASPTILTMERVEYLKYNLNLAHSLATHALVDTHFFKDYTGIANNEATDAFEKIVVILEQATEPTNELAEEIKELLDVYERIIELSVTGENRFPGGG